MIENMMMQAALQHSTETLSRRPPKQYGLNSSDDDIDVSDHHYDAKPYNSDYDDDDNFEHPVIEGVQDLINRSNHHRKRWEYEGESNIILMEFF